MKTHCMLLNKHLRHFLGFTLLEVSIVIILTVGVASVSLAMLNNNIAAYQRISDQEFITGEAPLIGKIVSELIQEADQFELYQDHSAIGGALTDGVTTLDPTGGTILQSRTLILKKSNPEDGTQQVTAISMCDSTAGNSTPDNDPTTFGRLEFFSDVDVPTTPPPAATPPNWTISTELLDATFRVEAGILRMTITGPRGESITYSGSFKL